MKKTFIIILLFISMCLWAQNVPQTIDYQGRLADSDGNYLNSVVTVDFLIYDAEFDGTLLWNESRNVSCANGIFHALLGSSVTFPTSLFDGADRWLELVVSSETLSPRTAIAAVPYSIKAETAYTVEVPINLSGNVSYPNSVITSENSGSGYGVYGKHYITDNYGYLGSPDYGVYGYGNYSGGYFEGDTYGVYGTASGFGVYGLHPTGNYGYIASSDYGVYGSSSGNFGYLGSTSYGVYGNSISNWAGYFEGKMHISDMVGIGTTIPSRMLTVNSTGANPIQWQVNSLILGQLGTNGSGAGGLYLYDNEAISTVITANGNSYFNGGNVGIGTDTPTSELTVAGTIESTSGGVKFPDGTTQTTAATGSTTYTIGDFALGGIVFWLDETGQHGLICAKEDQSSIMRWYAGTFGDTRAYGDHIYAGKMNTDAIVGSSIGIIGDDGSPYASEICKDLTLDGYSDWYLPSKEELNLMYENKSTIGATAIANGGSGFAIDYYWSSTERTNMTALRKYFGNGYQANHGKNTTSYVRAIRAF